MRLEKENAGFSLATQQTAIKLNSETSINIIFLNLPFMPEVAKNSEKEKTMENISCPSARRDHIKDRRPVMNRRGSVTVEAAVALPIFICCIVTVAFDQSSICAGKDSACHYQCGK